MINEPRVYRHSPIQFVLILVVFALLGIGVLAAFSRDNYFTLILVLFLVGIVFVPTIYSMTQKTIISDDGISTQTILGEKSLRWGEINRVSGRGYGIKLHNFDGDVTVVPGSQLPGYEEVVEWIGVKRPDLFNPLDYEEMKKGWFGIASFILVAMLGVAMFVGFVVAFSSNSRSSEDFGPFIPIVFIVFGLIVFWVITLFQVQSLAIEGKSLRMKYLFNEKTLLADEIVSIDMRYTQTRNGKNYFVQLTQANKKKIRISGLSPSLPIVYLVLKNWHRKNMAGGPSIARF
jgi:hypothetical protein